MIFDALMKLQLYKTANYLYSSLEKYKIKFKPGLDELKFRVNDPGVTQKNHCETIITTYSNGYSFNKNVSQYVVNNLHNVQEGQIRIAQEFAGHVEERFQNLSEIKSIRLNPKNITAEITQYTVDLINANPSVANILQSACSNTKIASDNIIGLKGNLVPLNSEVTYSYKTIASPFAIAVFEVIQDVGYNVASSFYKGVIQATLDTHSQIIKTLKGLCK